VAAGVNRSRVGCAHLQPYRRAYVVGSPSKEQTDMSDEIDGTVNKVAGKVQGAAGDILGDAKTSIDGRLREAAGKIQENYGAAAEQVRGFTEELTERIHETPLLAVLAAAGLGYLLGRITARD
jgi:uncharacterized protein YjbJ (UPF0337 family)